MWYFPNSSRLCNCVNRPRAGENSYCSTKGTRRIVRRFVIVKDESSSYRIKMTNSSLPSFWQLCQKVMSRNLGGQLIQLCLIRQTNRRVCMVQYGNWDSRYGRESCSAGLLWCSRKSFLEYKRNHAWSFRSEFLFSAYNSVSSRRNRSIKFE